MRSLEQVLEDGVSTTGEVPGAAAAYATRDGMQFLGAAGSRCLASGDPMRPDALFRIASMTKAITSVAALQFVDSGDVSLDDEMSRYIPELADRPVLEHFGETGDPTFRPARGAITLRRLLTHTAGFGYDFLSSDLRRGVEAGIVGDLFAGDDVFLNAPLIRDPGTRWEYGINTDWVGCLVESLSGESLGDYCRSQIFEPLGMNDTTFEPAEEQISRLVTVHRRAPDGSLIEDPDNPPPKVSFHSGGGGLYSTARDYLRFLQAILLGGELEGARILSEAMVAEAAKDQIAPLRVEAMKSVDPALCNDVDAFAGAQHGLGFVINPDALATGRSAGSLTWAGIYNSYYWIDPSRGVAGVFLSQILPFYDSAAVALSQAFESAVYDALDTTS
jgi:methyl acetate hydrolase